MGGVSGGRLRLSAEFRRSHGAGHGAVPVLQLEEEAVPGFHHSRREGGFTIRVSAQTDEEGFAAPAVLVADAVKLEAVE